MSQQTLHYQRVVSRDDPEPSQWFWALHGAFGSGRSWRAIAQRLADASTGFGGVLPDLREHGRSVGRRRGPHHLEAAARDLHELDDPSLILGHSFGGKLALQYAADRPVSLKQVWVIDSTPAVIDPETGDAWAMIKLLRQLPKVFDSRDQAVDAMKRRGLSSPVATWMAMNVERADDVYRWRFELDGLEALALDFYETDLWHVVENPPADLEIHFVVASEGHMMSPQARDRLQSLGQATGRIHLHDVTGGHWLNVDNPEALVDLITPQLQSL